MTGRISTWTLLPSVVACRVGVTLVGLCPVLWLVGLKMRIEFWLVSPVVHTVVLVLVSRVVTLWLLAVV